MSGQGFQCQLQIMSVEFHRRVVVLPHGRRFPKHDKKFGRRGIELPVKKIQIELSIRIRTLLGVRRARPYFFLLFNENIAHKMRTKKAVE